MSTTKKQIGVDFTLEDTPAVSRDDLGGVELSEEEWEVVTEMERDWSSWLASRPHALTIGKKEETILSLMEEIETLSISGKTVETELQRQLEFFDKARDGLEHQSSDVRTKANQEHRAMMEEMNTNLDVATKASKLADENAPWNLFNELLEDAVKLSGDSFTPGRGGKALKPSVKGMILAGLNEETDSKPNLLRAYRVDNELLLSQLAVLQRELEQMEKSNQTLDEVGKFLTEHNIWNLLTNRGSFGGSITSRNPLTVVSGGTNSRFSAA
eukprot:Nitzschia sp. Nitz4//scaffold230_size58257//38601//39410//NITZ4_006486-RA/size58257-processed-gene-0.67-mRNA-1//-1//CDS//3329543265//8581//frame0